jgi:hypothetical protein
MPSSIRNRIFLRKVRKMSEFTLDEAIKVLRQHNVTGASVLRITRGQALEKDLLAQVLDSCEQLISEKAEYKKLLKAAVEDFRWLESHTEDGKGHCCISGDNKELACIHCPLNQRNKDTIMCGWNYEDEALALIGEDGDTECQ